MQGEREGRERDREGERGREREGERERGDSSTGETTLRPSKIRH